MPQPETPKLHEEALALPRESHADAASEYDETALPEMPVGQDFLEEAVPLPCCEQFVSGELLDLPRREIVLDQVTLIVKLELAEADSARRGHERNAKQESSSTSEDGEMSKTKSSPHSLSKE